MNQLKRTLCLVTALTLCICTAACGKKSEEASLTSQSAELLSKSDSQSDTTEDTTEEEEDDEDDDAPIDLDNIKVKGETTSAQETADADSTTTTTVKSETTDDATSTTTTAQAGSSKTTTAAGNSGNSSRTTTATQAATQAATEAPTEAPTEELTDPDPDPEPDVPAEENVVSGVIDFNTNTFQGEGISLSGATYTITGEGTYILTGTLTGNVEVNSTAKVKLKLGGVSITNPCGPAIVCTNAKKLTLTLIEGTQNTLSDGANADFNGCITSNDTLEIKGAGALNISANNAHGIASDDDIIIKNGDITINAVKSGMIANDDITVSGGTIRATGGTNGIKSKASVHIEGGTLFLYGGPREDKSAIYAGTFFSLTGGYVYALGCGAAQPDPATSTQCSICVKFTPSLAENSWAAINCNGMQFLNETSPYAFNTVFLSTPDVYDGMAYNVFANGIECGEGFITAGLSSAVAVEVPQE